MFSLDFLQGKTVLVTGATGFIGHHLAKRLRAIPDVRLVILSRREPQQSDSATWVQSGLDRLHTEVWLNAKIERIDIVFHLAAFIPKSTAEADNLAAIYTDNLLGTRCLLESFPSPPQRIVFASTVDVYALPTGDVALSEASRIAPATLYGASKFFCEQLISSYARQHKCGCAILRYGHIFGPGEEAFQKLIPQTIRGLLCGESPTLYGDGSAMRDLIYVEDAVEATLRAATVSESEPINIVRDESITIRHVVETLADIMQFKEPIRLQADKPTGYSLQFDAGRMREVLGTWNYVSLEEGLRREVKHFQNLASGTHD